MLQVVEKLRFSPNEQML